MFLDDSISALSEPCYCDVLKLCLIVFLFVDSTLMGLRLSGGVWMMQAMGEEMICGVKTVGN